MKHLDIRIFGLVQGVGFRYSAKREADRLGIAGFARNEDDGSVSIEAEGSEKDLREFLEWCHTGPETAEVKSVEEKWTDGSGKFSGFRAI